MLVFQLADRWGESDPRKIAALPAQILNHWRAYFKLQGITADAVEDAAIPQPDQPSQKSIDAQCADVMRVLGNG
ncbi:hypothetical protein CEQ31_003620 [Serratia odorifera]|nr:hypothetical protein CEQ31_003620 [Serratia odorifera]RII69801.1 hypothetical protein DX901_22660 [Serratia odorifera]